MGRQSRASAFGNDQTVGLVCSQRRPNVRDVSGSCPAATRLKLDNQMPDTTSRKQTSISPDPSPTCAPEHRARGSHITCRIDACRESAVSSTASLASSPIPSCCPFRGRLLNKSVRGRGTAPNTSRSKRRRARAGPSDQSPSAPTPRRCPARRSRNHQGASSFGGPQDRHGVGAFGVAGVSERSFGRLSRRAFGFAPSLLLRRQRFLRTLGAVMLDMT